MNIKALRQKKADALAKAKQAQATAEKENRLMAEVERAEFDAAMAEVKATNEEIARVEAMMDEERTAPAAQTAARADVPEAGKSPWKSMGEQLQAIAKHTQGRGSDPRIKAALGSNEAVDAEGNFLVNPEYVPGILKRTYDTGLIAGLCAKMPMEGNRLILNAVDEDARTDGARWGGIQAYWAAEATSYTPSKPKFRQMELNANKLIGLAYATEELLADTSALAAYINEAFPQEFAFKIDDAIYNGSGAGIPLGFFNSGALLTVSKEGGQAAATIVTNNILKMWQRMPARSRKTCVWLVNQDIEAQLYPLTLGSGSLAQVLMYTPPGVNGNASGYGLLMGRPVIPVEQAATLGTSGDIVLVDLQQYLLAQKADIRADVSIHVAFLTGEQAFRFMLRLDGQPMWKKPLTPKNGSNTLSPFVALQAR